MQEFLPSEQFDQGDLYAKKKAFESMSPEEKRRHRAISWYGDFQLTDAVRPDTCEGITPCEGYRRDLYSTWNSAKKCPAEIPKLTVSATRKKLFSIFMELTRTMSEIDAVKITSEHLGDRKEFFVHPVDAVMFKLRLEKYEDLLMNDGQMTIGIYAKGTPPPAIVLEDSKIIRVYRYPHFSIKILQSHGLQEDPFMEFIDEGRYVSASSRARYKILNDFLEENEAFPA